MPFIGVVVQIHVSDFHVTRRQRFRVHAEAVILRGDFHFFREQIFHRMIRAVMPELQLERAPAQRQPAQLMSQANSKNRNAAR